VEDLQITIPDDPNTNLGRGKSSQLVTD
jgi:hypothetical protein